MKTTMPSPIGTTFCCSSMSPMATPMATPMPAIFRASNPNTNRGIVSDVCLKRKVRNFVELFPPERASADGNGYNLLIRQGAVLNNEIKNGIERSGESLTSDTSNSEKQEATMRWLCREFFDVRTFGGVLSTGDDIMKGSAWGQVRGPVQFTFGQSYHPITPLEISITRCAVTKEEDAEKERTMGNKHIVPYALYATKVYISPAFAERTGFTNADFEVLFDALNHMFEHDRSAARGEMVVRGVYDFEHVGTQHENNADQNRQEARLGCAQCPQALRGHRGETEGRNGISRILRRLQGHLLLGQHRSTRWRPPAQTSMNEAGQSSDSAERIIPLSAINQYLYCSRRAALIHVEGTFSDNEHTVIGSQLHEHADVPGYEKAAGIRVFRALPIWSQRLGLSGRCDIVEVKLKSSSKQRKSRIPAGEYRLSLSSRGTKGADIANSTTTTPSFVRKRCASKKCSGSPFPVAPSFMPRASAAGRCCLPMSYAVSLNRPSKPCIG